MRERSIDVADIIHVLRYPWKILRDSHRPMLRGYTRMIYVSKKKKLFVVVEENFNVIVITAWRRVRNIEEHVRDRVKRGVWFE